MRLLRSVLSVLAVVLAVVFFASPSFAQTTSKTEKEARALQKKAMEEDYLGTEFAAAQTKLDKAIALCGTDNKCSQQARAQLRRDLGVVLIGGQIDKNKGEAAFIEAFKLDPSITLDPDLKTKDLEASFEAARKKAAGGGGSTSAGGQTSGGGGGAVAGDFTHAPATEGQVRTPVPVYVEYAGGENIVKVLVRYKGFGMTEFKPLELKKVGTGWGGYVPCGDVQQGNLQYYVQGFNDQNDPVATAGDRNNTYKVAVKTKIAGAPPSLPGQQPPQQCAEAGDCPGPEFPCWAAAQEARRQRGEKVGGTKSEGAECEESSECSSNECKNGLCTAPAEDGATGKHKKIWLGAAITYGVTLLSAGSDVCKLDDRGVPLNSPAYYCIVDGRDYPTRAASDENNRLEPGKAGSIDGGFSPGSARIMFTFDFAPKPNFMLGARLGVVANNVYPGSEAQRDAKSNDALKRLHAEARFTYLFGKNPMDRTAAYAHIGAGISEWHGKVAVPVAETNAGLNKKVDAYLIGGPAFVGIGGGARLKLSPNAALMVGPRIDFAIGYVGVVPTFGLEGGVQFGL